MLLASTSKSGNICQVALRDPNLQKRVIENLHGPSARDVEIYAIERGGIQKVVIVLKTSPEKYSGYIPADTPKFDLVISDRLSNTFRAAPTEAMWESGQYQGPLSKFEHGKLVSFLQKLEDKNPFGMWGVAGGTGLTVLSLITALIHPTALAHITYFTGIGVTISSLVSSFVIQTLGQGFGTREARQFIKYKLTKDFLEDDKRQVALIVLPMDFDAKIKRSLDELGFQPVPVAEF